MNHFAKVLRHNATVAERLLWGRLRCRQLGAFRFRRQRPIGNYVCDFVCLSNCLVVELDGSQHVEQSDYDAERDAFLRSKGYRVLRFWNADVMDRLDTVLETIFQALQHEYIDGRID
jgi:very-short-patch-repair endonuclease